MSRGGFEGKNQGLDFPGMEGGDSERKIEARRGGTSSSTEHAPRRSIESRDDEICFEPIYRLYLSPLISKLQACSQASGLSAELPFRRESSIFRFEGEGRGSGKKMRANEKAKERNGGGFFFLPLSFSSEGKGKGEENLSAWKFESWDLARTKFFFFHFYLSLGSENLRGERFNERINILDNSKRARETCMSERISGIRTSV